MENPGYINITLKNKTLSQIANEYLQDKLCGVDQDDKKMTVLMDYGGANIAKELHVGHLCSPIIGEAEINLNVSLEVFLYDSNDIIVATYSPTHWNGKVEKLERGPFEIHDSFELPDMLTTGEYTISIVLSQMNIEHLARIE